jgi:hypothetical protein
MWEKLLEAPPRPRQVVDDFWQKRVLPISPQRQNFKKKYGRAFVGTKHHL